LDGPAIAPRANQPKLKNSSLTALRALREALIEIGSIPPASNHIPSATKRVTIDQWRKYAYARGISSGEERARQKGFKSASRNSPLVSMSASGMV
jgi:hypothetical protein